MLGRIASGLRCAKRKHNIIQPYQVCLLQSPLYMNLRRPDSVEIEVMRRVALGSCFQAESLYNRRSLTQDWSVK